MDIARGSSGRPRSTKDNDLPRRFALLWGFLMLARVPTLLWRNLNGLTAGQKLYPSVMITATDVALVVVSGAAGVICAQFLSIWHARKLVKLDVLRKIAGNRAAVSDNPLLDQRARFFEGLNEVMIVFSDSSEVSKALIEYKAALGTSNHNDRLIDLFKAICQNVGINPSAFNDSLFLQPFTLPR